MAAGKRQVHPRVDEGGNIVDHYGGPLRGPEGVAGGGTGGWATLRGGVYTLTGAWSNAPNYGDWARSGGYSATVGGTEGIGFPGEYAFAEAMYHPERETRGFAGRGPRGYRRSDESIADEIHRRLTDDPWVDGSDVEISVQDGIVRLTGSVHDRRMKRRAENVVAGVSGVVDVFNELERQ